MNDKITFYRYIFAGVLVVALLVLTGLGYADTASTATIISLLGLVVGVLMGQQSVKEVAHSASNEVATKVEKQLNGLLHDDTPTLGEK